MSKGLKELKEIELKWQYGVFTFIPNFEIIEKELKAFDIIKEKEVNISMLKSYLKCGVGLKKFTYQEYKKYNHTIFSKIKLTREQFDLFREVLL